MIDSGFRITKEQVGVILSWLGYIEQTRLALELEGERGHEALCDVLEKAGTAIYSVISELPAA